MEKTSEKSKDFFIRVYEITARIPFGKVTTYGSIAKALGMKSSARMVGWALNACAGDYSLPCHRVVNRNGDLTGSRYFPTPTLMRELLEAEGVKFLGDAVDIKNFLWEAPLQK